MMVDADLRWPSANVCCATPATKKSPRTGYR